MRELVEVEELVAVQFFQKLIVQLFDILHLLKCIGNPLFALSGDLVFVYILCEIFKPLERPNPEIDKGSGPTATQVFNGLVLDAHENGSPGLFAVFGS